MSGDNYKNAELLDWLRFDTATLLDKIFYCETHINQIVIFDND